MKRDSVPVTGISSLLTVFAVLCITVFAVLSISTARSDQLLSDRMASAAAEYYAADCAAEEILAKLRQGEVPEGVSVQNRDYSYTCVISESRELKVKVRIEPDGSYRIMQWQMVSSAEWNADDSLQVWDGE